MNNETKKAITYALAIVIVIAAIVFTIRIRLNDGDHEGHDYHRDGHNNSHTHE